jgi:hypothetical protein
VSKPWLDRNGLWQATARWGDHSRKIALDYRGHLAER